MQQVFQLSTMCVSMLLRQCTFPAMLSSPRECFAASKLSARPVGLIAAVPKWGGAIFLAILPAGGKLGALSSNPDWVQVLGLAR